jgi:hypothetical protein
VVYLERENLMTYYKFLTDEHKGQYSEFDFTAYLPKKGKPGKWLPKVDKLEKCSSGYHSCKPEQILRWLNAEMYAVEYKTPPEEDDDKVWGTQIRFIRKVDTFNDRTLRLFAVWCAREALKLTGNPDPRSVNACDVAERFANGEATQEELAAAWDAAGAAWDAAGDAARDAAGDAARDAAWAAARDAAWDAAGAAWDAAGDAWAAWDAARDAARDAQTKKLWEMLGEQA